MKDFSIGTSKELRSKLELIEKLLIVIRYMEALAEIRDFESSERIGTVPSQELFQFYYLKAFVLRSLGRYQDALESGRMALSTVKDTSDNKKIAQIQYILGLIHISLGNLRSAEVEIRDALTGFKREEDYYGIVDTLSRLGQIDFIKSNYTKAVDYTLEAIEYSNKIGDSKKTAILLGNLGVRYTLMGRWKEAEENLRLNVKLNEENQDKINLTRGLLSLGYVMYLRRKFKDTLICYEKALKLIYENNYMREMAIYYEYYGELAFAQGNYFLAKDHCRNGIKIGEEIAPDSGIVSQTYRLLADVQIAEKQYNEALSSCEKALKVAESLGERIEIGAIHRALGQIYTAKKEKEKAKENFEESLSILEEIGAKFELGKAYLEAGKSDGYDFFTRVQYLGRAKEIFQELDSAYYVGLVQVAISRLFFEQEEFEKSHLFLDDAEMIFKGLKEDRELSVVSILRKNIEKVTGKFETNNDTKCRYTFSCVITQNRNMLDLIEKLQRIKDSDFTILLEGETGTGKDLLAKAIHYDGKRKNAKFVAALCSSIPESLLENALFGHAKGAYTGAGENSAGLFEEAGDGTLYLDEIAEIPTSTQVKLLRAIEEKEITRIGETKPRKVDVRIISSTSRNLSERVESGFFRKDLYYRLNALSFKLPPLRERKEDVLLLMEHFLKDNGWGEEATGVLNEPELIEIMQEYDWPGNVRELKHEIEKLVTMTDTTDGVNLNLLKEKFHQRSGENGKPSLCEEVNDFEKNKIINALKQSGGNKSQAARILGTPVATLWNKLKKYKIE